MSEFDALVELVPLPIRVFDADGLLVRRNAAAIAEDAGLHGTSLRDVWLRDEPLDEHGEPVPFDRWVIPRALRGETIRGEINSVLRQQHRKRIAVYAAPAHSSRGNVVVVVEQHLPDTERAHGEKSAESTRDERLPAVARLAAGVMHDVNNALNPIMGAAYLLQRHAESPDLVREYAERIRVSAEMGAAKAARVGRFIRQQPTAQAPDLVVDLSRVAASVLERVREEQEQRVDTRRLVQFESVFAPAANVNGSESELREAVQNIVDNALHAMPSGGTLTMRTVVDEKGARLSVQDTGTGMEQSVRERAFEPFFTTRGAGGLGLGLSEVYGIVRQHNGSVSIESRPNEGTTVTISLPLAAQPVDASAPIKSSGAASTAVSLRVLIVEDHDEGSRFLTRLLSAEGHMATVARTCAEARERLAQDGCAAYDLLITDVGLPDCSGWDLVSHAKSQCPALRIGVITGWEPTGASTDTRRAEFVLGKPLRAAELLAHIEGRDSSA